MVLAGLGGSVFMIAGAVCASLRGVVSAGLGGSFCIIAGGIDFGRLVLILEGWVLGLECVRYPNMQARSELICKSTWTWIHQ